MEHPCKLCDGVSCCHGKDDYCMISECCDPFLCLCYGMLITEKEVLIE
jgi:hypothetical protein